MNCKVHSVSDSVLKLVGIVAAFSLFGLVMMGLKDIKDSKTVCFVAGISYEMYLVSHVFSYGRFSVMNICPHWCIGILLLMFISIILAWLLNKIGKISLA